ncbi:hypothetical protein ABW20_dc0103118 [Dactylellina cionopaga]|nr:hypothetical protein ABW20_dc0103118 [Dactylellina cionopaga]
MTDTILPTEILLNIFENLPTEDLARVRRTCKPFNDVGNLVRRLSIKLCIDAPNFAAWKLIRSILANPALGEKIVKVSVRWCRRDPDRIKTLIGPWQWSQKEEDQIRDACNIWGLSYSTGTAIIAGINSESMLPFLLCFTPNIRVFKLGHVDSLPIKVNGRITRRVVQAFNSCLLEDQKGSVGQTRKDAAKEWGCSVFDLKHTDYSHTYNDTINSALKNLAAVHIPNADDWGGYDTWFDSNLIALSQRLPWFTKLENVKVFCNRQGFVDREPVKFGHFCSDDTEESHEIVDITSDEEEGLEFDDEPFPSDLSGDTTEDSEDDSVNSSEGSSDDAFDDK